MTYNKKFENLYIYLARPMEDDHMANRHEQRFMGKLHEAGIPMENMYGPCSREKEKTGFNVQDSNTNLAGWRLSGQNDKVSKVYYDIWKEDIKQIVKADIIIAHIRPGLRFTGTAVEGTIADLANFIDPIRDMWKDDYIERTYTDVVRPWFIKAGFHKPIHLVTPVKTEINGTYVHKIVYGSGGQVFKTLDDCITSLKEKYK